MPVVANDGSSPPEWKLSPRPVLAIGGDNGPPLFWASAGVVLNDRIIIADGGAATLHYYSREGRFLRDAGRRGQGPGEFQHLTWLGVLAGDSVAAWDPVLRRLSIFDREGRFVRMASVRGTQGPLPDVHGAFTDGSLLLADARPRAQTQPPGAVWRDTVVYLRVGRLGEITDTLGHFPGTEWFVAPGATSRVHTLPMGRHVTVAVHGATFIAGSGDAYELGVYGWDGTPRLRIRKPHRPVAVTDQDRREFLAGIIRVGGSEEERRERASEMERAPFPKALPPYNVFTADAGGNLWVREPLRPAASRETSRWSVFNQRGEWIATVHGPGRLKPLQIGPDWVLASGPDADDVDHVRIYALERS